MTKDDEKMKRIKDEWSDGLITDEEVQTKLVLDAGLSSQQASEIVYQWWLE